MMSSKVSNGIYIFLGILNAALLAATQQNMVPVQYAHYVALASIVVAGALKSFMPGPAEAPPADGVAK